MIASTKTIDELQNALSSTKDTIQGLDLVQDFITEQEETDLLKNIDKSEWIKLAKNKYQLYGYEYMFGINAINKNNVKKNIYIYITFLFPKK